MFNCGSLYSSNSQCELPLPVEDDGDAETDLLQVSESEGSILAASDCEDNPGSSDASGDIFNASDAESEIFLASDAEGSKLPKKTNQRRLAETMLLGKVVCIHALQSLLGIGSSTIQRIRAGQNAYTNARRQPSAKHPTFGFKLDHATSTKWVGVVMFLWEIYHSSAEVLPTDFKMPRDEEAKVPESRDTDFELRRVNHFIQSLQTFSNDPDVNLIGPGTFAGGCRFLQASTRTELFWEYQAASSGKGEEPASYSTFLRVANCILKPGIRNGHLKFRGVNQHGKCNMCYELKLQIKNSKNRHEREEAYRTYSHHLLSQWLDRQQYWSYRSMSRTWFKTRFDLQEKWLWCQVELLQNLLLNACRRFQQLISNFPSFRMAASTVANNVCCLMLDGMDQSKFRIPRVADALSGSTSKLFQRLFRPVLHVTGAWAHGHKLHFFVSDEDLRKDSSTQQEVLSRTLSGIYNDFQDLPLGLVVQQDNTYREGKNQYFLNHIILLVATECFRFAVCNYLRVGHSRLVMFHVVPFCEGCTFECSSDDSGHEDLDQAFSQQAALICRHVFDTPEMVTEIMDTMCRPDNPGERERKRNKCHKVEASAEKLDEVAQWREWCSVAGIKLKGLRPLGIRVQHFGFVLPLVGLWVLELIGVCCLFVFCFIWGQVGSIRICRRCDVDHRSMGWCTVQELPGKLEKKPGDILLIAKKKMADAEPYSVVVLMRQERATALKQGFCQPTGVASRRPISEQVSKNIATIAPRCCKQGIINQTALSYLTSWSQGLWPRLRRPTSYVHLQRRIALPFDSQLETPSWSPPNRIKHVDLSFDGVEEDSDGENEGEIALGSIQDA